jgi:uncharacterized membrane protein YfcA
VFVSFPEAAGLEVNVLLLVFIGFTVGVIAGFIGVGGGYIVTPALVVLGLPGSMAAGTGMTYIAGNSVMASLRHRELGNVDARLGLLMVMGTVPGVEVGVRLVNWLKDLGLADEAILAASLAIMAPVGAYTAVEAVRSRRRLEEMASAQGATPREVVAAGLSRRVQAVRLWPMVTLGKSRVSISLWPLLGVSFLIGILAGFMGVGGGFLKTPALIYVIGIPSVIAVGTSLFEIMIAGAYGLIRHSMSGNVLIYAAFLMVLGAAVGSQIGALATRYVTGPVVRFTLASGLGFAVVGAAVRLADVLTGETREALDIAAKAAVFCGMGFMVLAIFSLLGLALLRQSGRSVPAWVESVVARGP